MVNQNKGSGFRIIVTPNRPDARWDKVVRDFENLLKSEAKKLERKALSDIKRATPVRTGATRDAWRSSNKVNRFDFEVKLHNPLPQSQYINTGTKPSPGRYVPQLDRRLVTVSNQLGQHPGVTGTKYQEQVKEDLENNIISEVIPRIRRFVQTFINSNLRGGL